MSKYVASAALFVAAMATLVWAGGCAYPPIVPAATSFPEPARADEAVVVGPALPSPTIAAPTPTPPPAAVTSEPTMTTPAQAILVAAPLELTLVHTSDTWGYVLPCG
jgi:hypothetical protein